MGIDAPHALVHSFVGIIAMVYATRHPRPSSKLILSGTSTRPIGERSFEAFERLGGLRARAAAMAFWQRPDGASWAAYAKLCSHCTHAVQRRSVTSSPRYGIRQCVCFSSSATYSGCICYINSAELDARLSLLQAKIIRLRP